MAHIVLATAYLPPIEYFYFLVNGDSCIVETCEFYKKQTYRNRCNIITATDVQSLSIPIVHKKTKMAISEVEIDYKTDWCRQHWRTIITSYNKSPFFLYYRDYIEAIYIKKPKKLLEFNTLFTQTILKLLGAPTVPKFTTEYFGNSYDMDFRTLLSPKRLSDFSPHFFMQEYDRLFTQKFLFYRGISIIDLIFNKGTESLHWLQSCCQYDYNNNISKIRDNE